MLTFLQKTVMSSKVFILNIKRVLKKSRISWRKDGMEILRFLARFFVRYRFKISWGYEN